jgi:hypothetical protein
MANAYLVGSYNKVILSGDLGVHIGVYQPCPKPQGLPSRNVRVYWLSVNQVTDEVLYTGLVEMQEMDELA